MKLYSDSYCYESENAMNYYSIDIFLVQQNSKYSGLVGLASKNKDMP